MNGSFPTVALCDWGERVAKTTTGYDLFRFFLNAGQRFGQPRDLVLRLRPRNRPHHGDRFEGGDLQIGAAAAELLTTCWLHWLDAIDLIAADSRLQLRIKRIVRLMNGVCSILVSEAGRRSPSPPRFHGRRTPAHGWLADVVLKTTPDQVAELTSTIAKTLWCSLCRDVLSGCHSCFRKE